MSLKEDPTEVQRRNMRKLLRVVEEVRREHPRMEMPQLAILLAVLAEPGIWTKDLGNIANIGRSALSRNVKALSQSSYLSDEEGQPRDGLDLITQIPDIFDRRAMQLAPTRRGLTLLARLSALLED